MSKPPPVALPEYKRVSRSVVVLHVQTALQRAFDANGDLAQIEASAKAVGEVSAVPEPGTGLTVLVYGDRKLANSVTERALAGAKVSRKSEEGQAIEAAVHEGYYDGATSPRKFIVTDLPTSMAQLEIETERAVEVELRRREVRRRVDEFEADHDDTDETYIDVAKVLAGDMEPPSPDRGGVRSDGERTLYGGTVNGLVGESEAGKTIIAACMAADELRLGGSVQWLDLDHNGASGTVRRLVQAGVAPKILRDPSRFRLYVPESRGGVLRAAEDAESMRPTMAIVDSVGELIPMFDGDSNSADDYSRVHREVFARLAAAGAAVLVIDHLAKTALGTGYASGTGAKKRAMDGAYYGVKILEPLRPGDGGASALSILKDRFGGVRAKSPGATAAVFRLDSRNDQWSWDFHPGKSADERDADQTASDVAFVLSLEPFPSSRDALVRAVRLASDSGKGWRTVRADAALKAARAHRENPPIRSSVTVLDD